MEWYEEVREVARLLNKRGVEAPVVQAGGGLECIEFKLPDDITAWIGNASGWGADFYRDDAEGDRDEFWGLVYFPLGEDASLTEVADYVEQWLNDPFEGMERA